MIRIDAVWLAMRVTVSVSVWGPVSVPMAMAMAQHAALSFDRSPAQVETAHQGIDALGGQCLGLSGQVGVAVGGEDGVVAQDVLNVLQADASLDQVGCIAVASIPMSA